jgi:hypothetical protein
LQRNARCLTVLKENGDDVSSLYSHGVSEVEKVGNLQTVLKGPVFAVFYVYDERKNTFRNAPNGIILLFTAIYECG